MNNYLLSRRTPVRDHAGELLYQATREQALQLLARHDVGHALSGRRVKSFQLYGPDPAHLSMSGSRHRRGIGDPHRNENYWNPAGCWTHNRIPSSWQELFTMSITERLRYAESRQLG